MITNENFEVWDESGTAPIMIIDAATEEIKRFEVWIDESTVYLDIRDVASYRMPPFII